ncbi:MAG: TrkH family potassium uptake protein, partial [Syntrophomonadaceae bacterium]
LDKSSNLVDVKGIINQNSTGYYALRPYCGFKEHGFCYYAKSSLSRTFAHNHGINYREGFAIVTLGWIAASLFGTLPFIISGYIPSFADALFETVSGFTTTGASILTDVEALPKSLLFWRSLTQWLGGMGIMALFIAIIVGLGVRANQIFRAEVPGPVSNKISPRIRDTARSLWLTYVVLSGVLFLLLSAFGMDIFDSLCHTFSTMATGGFSTKNQSIGYYSSPYIQWTITLFMFLAGANFALHYMVYKEKTISQYWQDKEFKLYSFIIIVSSMITFLGILHISGGEEKFRAAVFQVVSIITTTGYATADFDLWAPMGKGILLLLMLVGACAGSTSGGIKVGRYLIMLQRAKIELQQMVHPKAMMPLRLGDRVITDALVINVLQFFFIYIFIVLVSTLIMNIMGLDYVSGLTAVLTCIGNIGPGFGLVGPTRNFGFLSDTAKYLLSLLMLLGRLEIYPFLILFVPQYWKE